MNQQVFFLPTVSMRDQDSAKAFRSKINLIFNTLMLGLNTGKRVTAPTPSQWPPLLILALLPIQEGGAVKKGAINRFPGLKFKFKSYLIGNQSYNIRRMIKILILNLLTGLARSCILYIKF